MRATNNLADDALIAVRDIALRERQSLGDAVSELIRRGSAVGTRDLKQELQPALRDEVVTPQHVRELMEREGI